MNELDVGGDSAGERHNLVGLARVSTSAQDAQLQHDALGEAGCGRIFEEKISTARPSGPACRRAGLPAARRHAVRVETRRLGRSARNILIIADSLHRRGIGLRILTGKMAGTYTPGGEGKFFFTMMAAFAELERDIIHERTMAGLAPPGPRAAPAAGPPSWTPASSPPPGAAAPAEKAPPRSPRPLGVSRASICRHLAATPGGQQALQDQ